MIVKDNYETIDMPTTAGSLALKGMMTGNDAFVVKRLRDAGAVMIAKSNMAEFAFSQYETVYPTWSNPPRLIGDLNTPHGDNNQLFSPSTGFPAMTVPMGYARNNQLPAGLQFLGRAWSEDTLIRLAFAYEQATHHRRPPPAIGRPQ